MKHQFSMALMAVCMGAMMFSCSNDEPQLTNPYKPGDPAINPDKPDQPEESGKLDFGELYAFPGAEGHGRNTTGGRGGAVYHVTSLEDDGSEGTLRWAIEQKGARTIVFDVAGTIHLKSEMKTKYDDLTIAGQTSPGGICLADYGFTINSSNVIIRFLRFRPGVASGKEPDGLGGMDKQNIIVDHCSVSWSVDECLSVYGMQNSTVQWCLAYQALRHATHVKGNHGYGGNWGGHNASYHHNLIAHCESRVPRLGPRYTTLAIGEYVDIRNNVYYNWNGEGCYGGEAQNTNIVNNYYKPGPATDSKRANRIAKIGIYAQSYVAPDENGNPTKNKDYAPYLDKWGTFYITGNKVVGDDNTTNDNWTYGVYNQQKNGDAVDNMWIEETMVAIKKDAPVVSSAGVTTHSADDAYSKVLAYGGACNYRDAVDKLVLGDVENKKASCTASGNSSGYINSPEDVLEALPELNGDPYPKLEKDANIDVTDTDGDGIPDTWEKSHGLDPESKDDGNATTIDVHGKYTNLEMYMNSLVKDIMDACREGGIVVE